MVVPGRKTESCFTRAIAVHLTDSRACTSSRDCDTSKTMLCACGLVIASQRKNTWNSLYKKRQVPGTRLRFIAELRSSLLGPLNITSWTRRALLVTPSRCTMDRLWTLRVWTLRINVEVWRASLGTMEMLSFGWRRASMRKNLRCRNGWERCPGCDRLG